MKQEVGGTTKNIKDQEQGPEINSLPTSCFILRISFFIPLNADFVPHDNVPYPTYSYFV